MSTWQAVRARRAETLALQTRGDAEELSNFILEDFYTELEPTSRLETVAQLAKQSVAYYDRLPVSLRTPETERNRAMAQARLALVIAPQGDAKTALPIASAAVARFEQFRSRGDASEAILFGLGVALQAQYWCYRVQVDTSAMAQALHKGFAVLKPLATSPGGSRRVKLAYADFLNNLSHVAGGEPGISMCEEALHLLAGLGALEGDLTAASAYADIADSEARVGLLIGRVDDAERLEKQTQMLAEGVLARRPNDLRARLDLTFAPDVLSTIEAGRFHDAAALQWAIKAQTAAEDFVRFNPSEEDGWVMLARRNASFAALLFRLGRVTDALQKAQAATAERLAPGSTNSNFESICLRAAMAYWQAQRGNLSAAEQALLQARSSFDVYVNRMQVQDRTRAFWTESMDEIARQVRRAFGEDAAVWSMGQTALERLQKLAQDARNQAGILGRIWRSHQALALNDSSCAALNLKRYAEAEAAARALLPLASEIGERFDPPHEVILILNASWARVLLADAAVGQGRREEAQKSLEPALTYYREAQARGATHVPFRQHFARVLYVQALAEAADPAGNARRRDELDQADRLLQGLPNEARQLYDSKELFSWIATARTNLSHAAPH